MSAEGTSRIRVEGIRAIAFAAIAVALLGGGQGICEGQTVEEVWNRRYPNPAPAGLNDDGVEVAFADNNLYVAGTQTIETGYSVMTVVKYDVDGNVVADAIWPGDSDIPGLYTARAMAVVHDELIDDVRVYVTGDVPGLSGQRNTLTVAYDSDLNLRWTRVYNHEPYEGFVGDDVPVAIDASDLFVAVAARSTGITSDADFASFAYLASDGSDAMPAQRYAGAYYDAPVDVVLDDDVVLVSGTSNSAGATTSIVTARYQIPTGLPLAGWPQTYSATNQKLEAVDVAIGANGGIYVAANITFLATLDTDTLCIKYSSVGSVVWTQTFDLSHHGPDRARALTTAVYTPPVGPAQHLVFLAAEGTLVGMPHSDVVLIQYRDEGGSATRQWVAQANGAAGLNDFPIALVATDAPTPGAFADVRVTASSDGPQGSADYWTLKYTSEPPLSGPKLPVWNIRYVGPGEFKDIPAGISRATLSGQDNVFVVGTSWGGTSANDLLTVRYRELP